MLPEDFYTIDQEWCEEYDSEKFDDDGNLLQQAIVFYKNKDVIVDIYRRKRYENRYISFSYAFLEKEVKVLNPSGAVRAKGRYITEMINNGISVDNFERFQKHVFDFINAKNFWIKNNYNYYPQTKEFSSKEKFLSLEYGLKDLFE